MPVYEQKEFQVLFIIRLRRFNSICWLITNQAVIGLNEFDSICSNAKAANSSLDVTDNKIIKFSKICLERFASMPSNKVTLNKDLNEITIYGKTNLVEHFTTSAKEVKRTCEGNVRFAA